MQTDALTLKKEPVFFQDFKLVVLNGRDAFLLCAKFGYTAFGFASLLRVLRLLISPWALRYSRCA